MGAISNVVSDVGSLWFRVQEGKGRGVLHFKKPWNKLGVQERARGLGTLWGPLTVPPFGRERKVREESLRLAGLNLTFPAFVLLVSAHLGS